MQLKSTVVVPFVVVSFDSEVIVVAGHQHPASSSDPSNYHPHYAPQHHSLQRHDSAGASGSVSPSVQPQHIRVMLPIEERDKNKAVIQQLHKHSSASTVHQPSAAVNSPAGARRHQSAAMGMFSKLLHAFFAFLMIKVGFMCCVNIL